MDNIKLRNLPNSQLKLNLLHIKLFLRAPTNTVFFGGQTLQCSVICSAASILICHEKGKSNIID